MNNKNGVQTHPVSFIQAEESNHVQWAQLIVGSAPRTTWTLAYGLKVIADNTNSEESITLALASAVITMIPILIVYLFAQSKLIIEDDIYKIIRKEKITALIVTHDINQAISMSDKVIVLSNRPACVKNVYDIKLTNKSTPINNRKCVEFNDYFDLIWRDLDEKLQFRTFNVFKKDEEGENIYYCFQIFYNFIFSIFMGIFIQSWHHKYFSFFQSQQNL